MIPLVLKKKTINKVHNQRNYLFKRVVTPHFFEMLEHAVSITFKTRQDSLNFSEPSMKLTLLSLRDNKKL